MLTHTHTHITTELTAFELCTDRGVPMTATRPMTSFPTAVVNVETDWLLTKGFLEEFSGLLVEAPDDCKRTSEKDGEMLIETREARSPKYFTEWLLPTLAAASSATLNTATDATNQRVCSHTRSIVFMHFGVNFVYRYSFFTSLNIDTESFRIPPRRKRHPWCRRLRMTRCF